MGKIKDLQNKIEILELQLLAEKKINENKSFEIKKLKEDYNNILERNIELINISEDFKNYDLLNNKYKLLKSKCDQQSNYIAELENLVSND